MNFECDYLSKEMADSLKGIFSIFVLIHHIYQHSGIILCKPIHYCLHLLGYWSVGMFLFLSGYGLMISYMKKGNDGYLKFFPRKRILYLYTISLVLIAIYSFFDILIGNIPSIHLIVKSLTFGETVISKGWYLQTILLFYIAFYIIFTIFKTLKGQMVGLTYFCVMYCVFCATFQFSMTWYVNTFTFLLGFIWCLVTSIYSQIFVKHSVAYFCLISISFGITSILEMYLKPFRIPIKMISEVLFVTAVMFFVTFISSHKSRIISNVFTKQIGKISLETYVSQGVFLQVFHSDKCYINNLFVYCIAVMAGTFALSILLHILFSNIYKKIGG